MNRKGYSELTFEKYVQLNSENSRIVPYSELCNFPGLETCFYEDLPKTEIKGFPFASDFADKDGNFLDYEGYKKLPASEKSKYKLRFHYLPTMHELYIGTTGSGKTTTCIEPQLRAISSQKNKPNIFISDPKGEILLHHAKHLVDNGYKVQVINFKNIKYSNCWNPLEEIYEKQIKIPEIGKGAKTIKSDAFDPKLTVYGSESEFRNGYHIVYDGIAFPSKDAFDYYVEGLKATAHAEVTSMVNQLCHQMFPEEKSTHDPTWSNGAREYFNGIILGLLEDAINPEKHLTKEMFNIKTVNDVYSLTFKYDFRDPEDNPESAKLEAFINDKSKECQDKLNPVARTADNTKRGFLSTCNSMIGRWMNGHIFSLIMNTNISLDDSKQPIALFVITRDYDKSDNTVAALFLNSVYRHFLEKAEQQERKNGISGGRPIHFLLDEFANIPAIPDFEIKIATSRSRNMWFHIFLQSYEQLSSVYVPSTANIIIDNCNQQTFLGSQSFETKRRFSSECGQKTVLSLGSKFDVSRKDVVTTPVVPISTLNAVETGWMYAKRIKMDVIKSTYIRSYQCADEGVFKDFYNKSYEKFTPFNLTNPADKKYQYEEIVGQSSWKDRFDFDLEWDDNEEEEEDETPTSTEEDGKQVNDWINRIKKR